MLLRFNLTMLEIHSSYTKIISFLTLCIAPFIETEGVFFRYISRPRTVSVIGVPLALGQNLDGVDTGPTVLREGGLFERIKEEKWTVEDTGDIDVPKVPLLAGDPKLHCAAEISQVNKATAERAYEHAKDNKFVLSIGGDHSIAIGSIAGLLKARPDMGTFLFLSSLTLRSPPTSSTLVYYAHFFLFSL